MEHAGPAYLGNRIVLEALSGIAWRRRHDGAVRPEDPLLGPVAARAPGDLAG